MERRRAGLIVMALTVAALGPALLLAGRQADDAGVGADGDTVWSVSAEVFSKRPQGIGTTPVGTPSRRIRTRQAAPWPGLLGRERPHSSLPGGWPPEQAYFGASGRCGPNGPFPFSLSPPREVILIKRNPSKTFG